MIQKFDWRIDSGKYLSNSDKHACKMQLKDFMKHVASYLDSMCNEDWKSIRNKPHCHPCHDLSRKKSSHAKRLEKHLREINKTAGDREGVQIEPFQIHIKKYPDRNEFRIFGYIKYNIFYLIYLDPKHEVYK